MFAVLLEFGYNYSYPLSQGYPPDMFGLLLTYIYSAILLPTNVLYVSRLLLLPNFSNPSFLLSAQLAKFLP